MSENQVTTTKLQAGLSLVGLSRATYETCFQIPELGICFDLGRNVSLSPVRKIFLTHTHTDHLRDILRIRNWENPPDLYLLPDYTESMSAFLNAANALTENKSWLSKVEGGGVHLRVAYPGKEIGPLRLGNRRFVIRTISCTHSAPCAGYAFTELRRKLKPELVGKSSQEIATIKQGGGEVTNAEEIPVFVYLGDTTTQVLDQNPWIFDFPQLIMECTFLNSSENERAVKTCHTCWDDLEPFVTRHQNTHFYLTHFSLRYSLSEVKTFFDLKNRSNVTSVGISDE